jgi:hypothetical protein
MEGVKSTDNTGGIPQNRINEGMDKGVDGEGEEEGRSKWVRP